MADAAAKKDDSSPIRDRLVDLKSQLPASVKQLASTSPYSPYSLSPLVSRSPAKPSQSSDPTDPSTLGSKFSTRKRLSTDMVKSPTKSNKKRSNSTSNLHQMSVGGAYVGGSRTATRSISPNQMVSTYSEQGVRSPPGVQNPPGNFQVPSEVLILPISKGSASFTSSSPAMALWDFALLSQEEVGGLVPRFRFPVFKASLGVRLLTMYISVPVMWCQYWQYAILCFSTVHASSDSLLLEAESSCCCAFLLPSLPYCYHFPLSFFLNSYSALFAIQINSC